jgi:O-antigen/teichoic acid export membrane protein
MTKGESWFSKSSVIYLLLHSVLILVGILLASHGGAIAISAGASLIATGVTGWVLFAHVRLNESQQSLISLLTVFGFVGAFDAVP